MDPFPFQPIAAFYALVDGARPPRWSPVVRFEGLPGEFSQHDFGNVDVRFVDGTQKRIHFFASRPKCSRFAAVTTVEGERPLLGCDFMALGGLPLMAAKADRYARRTKPPLRAAGCAVGG